MSGLPAEESRFTWDDYRSWDDGQRWEIIDGEAFAMTPVPLVRHQDVVGELYAALHGYFKGHACSLHLSPVDVKLGDADIVQPDLVVVCEEDKVTETHIEGAPTLVVEVLSPSTERFDRIRKMALYARSGVAEVWLVTPYPWLVEVYLLDGETYRFVTGYTKGDTLASPTFPELSIDLDRIFDFPIPPEQRIEMVREGRPPAYGVEDEGK